MRMLILLSFLTFTLSSSAFGAESHHLDGRQLQLMWVLPFVGILASIAVFPLCARHFWEHNFGKIAAAWAFTFLVPSSVIFGLSTTSGQVYHTIMLEYLPFLILLFSLFVVSGGISVVGNLVGNPHTNVGLLTLGTMLASLIGTTGASMLLIRPLIRANEDRRHNVHVFIFFIFLVANVGGSLTPLGDPPLFLGFLKGVDFFWTTTAMAPPMLVVTLVLLLLFYFIDRYRWKQDTVDWPVSSVPRQVRIEGLHNFVYLLGIVLAVLLSGTWRSQISIPVGLGVEIPLEGMVRDVALLLFSVLSLWTTRSKVRIENAFTWAPIQEVAYLFAGIFVTIIPILAILSVGGEGALGGIVALVTDDTGRPIDAAYFWLTGGLSSFLDNAPTYLVFFNISGGNPEVLMGPRASTLLAISAGAVFMGANTYIGNGPNFMVKAICEERGIRMPSFFGYMIWSATFMLPVLMAVTLIFFRD